MDISGYFILFEAVIFLASMLALGFEFNTTASKRGLHKACFQTSLAMTALSLSVLFLVAGNSGIQGAVMATVELLPAGLALAGNLVTAVHSFKLLA